MLLGSELSTKIRSFLKEKTEREKQKFAIKLEVTYVTVDDDTFEEIIERRRENPLLQRGGDERRRIS